MAVKKISITLFLEMAAKQQVIDVRSPGEFEQAHIPGAHSLPLFTNEERKVVGTLYKQESREKAIKKGLEYFGAKMVDIVEQAEKIVSVKPSKIILLHCWRGGMRSAAVAWLLELYGFDVYTLTGGYKAYRHWVLDIFNKEFDLKIIGGYTGSGKTEVLAEMKKAGLNVVDLEGIAHHKGSAFGAINMPAQPSQEMFENKLAEALNNFSNADTEQDGYADNTIYLEDESQRIGQVNIPAALWKQMRSRPVIFVQIPFEERLDFIVKHYGKGDKEKLINAIIRIKKRLGGLETKTAVNYLLEDDLKEGFRVLLAYYDKSYKKGLQSRESWEAVTSEINYKTTDAQAIARLIIKHETKEINA